MIKGEYSLHSALFFPPKTLNANDVSCDIERFTFEKGKLRRGGTRRSAKSERKDRALFCETTGRMVEMRSIST